MMEINYQFKGISNYSDAKVISSNLGDFFNIENCTDVRITETGKTEILLFDLARTEIHGVDWFMKNNFRWKMLEHSGDVELIIEIGDALRAIKLTYEYGVLKCATDSTQSTIDKFQRII